ncbi:MAG: outer membrane beta-barrel protein [Terracidiphilus sp.]|jgi:hypothetical protein
MGTLAGVTSKSQEFGGAARFNFLPAKKVVPYGVVGMGMSRFTQSASGVSASMNGYNVSFGGGASIYLGKNWGVRPEFRWQREKYIQSDVTLYSDVVIGSGSVFYQFGSQGKKKKTNTPPQQ